MYNAKYLHINVDIVSQDTVIMCGSSGVDPVYATHEA